MNLLNIKKLAAALTVACSLVFASTASAAPNLGWNLSTSFDVNSLGNGLIFPGNNGPADYKFDVPASETGSDFWKNALTTVISSDGLTAWVTWSPIGSLSFENVFLKAGNNHIVWDTSGVNWSIYNGLYVTNTQLKNPPGNAFVGISHISLDGTPITRVPDSASTLLLMGLGLASVCMVARRRRV